MFNEQLTRIQYNSKTNDDADDDDDDNVATLYNL